MRETFYLFQYNDIFWQFYFIRQQKFQQLQLTIWRLADYINHPMHATSKRGRTGFEVSDDISEEPSMGSYIQHQLFNKMPAWIHLLFHQGMTSEKAKSKCKVSFLVKRCWGSRKQETKTKQTILRLKLCLNFCIALSIKKKAKHMTCITVFLNGKSPVYTIKLS